MRWAVSMGQRSRYGARTARGLLGLLRSTRFRDHAPLVLLLTVNAVLLAVQPVLLGSLVGTIRQVAAGRADPSALSSDLVWLVAALFAAAAAQAGTSVAATWLERAVDGQVESRIRTVLTADADLTRIEDPAVQDDVTTAREGAHGVRLGACAVDQVRMVFQYVNAALLTTVVARASITSAIVMGAAVVAGRVLSINIGVRRTVPREQSAEQRALYLRDLAMGAGSGKEVRIFGTGDWLSERMTSAWRSFYAPMFAHRRGYLPRFVLLYLCLAAAYSLALAPLLLAALDDRLGVGELTAAASAAAAMLLTLTQAFTRYLYAGAPIRAYQRVVRHRTAVPPARADRVEGLPRAELPAQAPLREIRFEDVTFGYPGADSPVFDGLDLVLRAGESVGLVGLNGAGKTTLVKLLARLYEPQAGRITVDGVDLAGVDVAAWRARLAVLFQDFVRYELPMADNIRYGCHGLAADDGLLDSVVKTAGLGDLVQRLPQGLQTVLSPAYDGGVDLSGGEWQRTALARALFALRGGATVLVLDEPTAAYDVRAEEELFSRFLDLTEGLTTLLISHRMSAVRRAHRILVLDGGRIVEDGSHAELMAADGKYARLFTLQAAGIRGEAP